MEENYATTLLRGKDARWGGHYIGKSRADWLDSLGSRILVGKIYFGVFKKTDFDDS